MMNLRAISASAATAAVLCWAGATQAGTLFIGTDTEEFNSVATSYLIKATVSGANFVSQTNIVLSYPLNGIGDGPGFLYSGDPSSNTLRTIDYNGNLLTSVSAGFPSTCCNEEMQFLGGNLYHAHYSDNIQQIDPTTGAVIQTFPQGDMVGLAVVGSTIWATKWSAEEVGTWDPATNIFTPVFSTPQFAGALAYDPDAGILWVGQLGGQIVPYTLGGVALNGGFNPIAALGLVDANGDPIQIDTVDGLTFQGEGTQTAPEPATLGILGLGLAGLGFMRRRRAA